MPSTQQKPVMRRYSPSNMIHACDAMHRKPDPTSILDPSCGSHFSPSPHQVRCDMNLRLVSSHCHLLAMFNELVWPHKTKAHEHVTNKQTSSWILNGWVTGWQSRDEVVSNVDLEPFHIWWHPCHHCLVFPPRPCHAATSLFSRFLA